MKLHVVSFDVPYPADYGGVIDVFYKIKALNELGVSIILHCFQYGKRQPQPDLNLYCSQVFYYPRSTFMNPFIGKLPYIVKTRHSKLLLERLSADDAPVLFEGLHTCLYLDARELKGKRSFVRNHNIEGDYYHHLARVEQKPWKRQYFLREAKLLNGFEPVLRKATCIAAISPSDHEVLNARYDNSFYLPVFHQNSDVTVQENKGAYCLYHGNLAVGENDEAACFLAQEVFNSTDLKLVIAGNGPSDRLKVCVSLAKNIELREGLSSAQITDLIREAQVNVLPTFQSTGIKLKLLNAFYNGGHCVVNPEMIEYTGMEELAFVAKSVEEFRQHISHCMKTPFGADDIAKRRKVLAQFDVKRNAKLLMQQIWK